MGVGGLVCVVVLGDVDGFCVMVVVVVVVFGVVIVFCGVVVFVGVFFFVLIGVLGGMLSSCSELFVIDVNIGLVMVLL